MSSIKDILQEFCCFQGLLTVFWRLGEHRLDGTPLDESIGM